MSILDEDGYVNLNDNTQYNNLVAKLEYEHFDQFIEHLKYEMKNKGIKVLGKRKTPDDVLDYVYLNEDEYPVDGRKNEADQSRLLGKTLRYNRVMTTGFKDILEEMKLPSINDSRILAMWLTSYAYEFFFITMPKTEKDSIFETDVFDISNLTESFSELKKGFSLLFGDYSLGIANNDFRMKGFFDFNELGMPEFENDSASAYIDLLKTEGFIDEVGVKSDYEKASTLNTFFVILFVDMAEEIILKLINDMKGGFYLGTHKLDTKKNPLMKFMMKEFMPKAIEEIKTMLISDDISSFGMNVYDKYKNISSNRAVNENLTYLYNDLGNIYRKDLRLYLTENFNKWDEWLIEKTDKSFLYSEWRKNIIEKNDDFFDVFDITKTEEELLFDTFKDMRPNSIHKKIDRKKD